MAFRFFCLLNSFGTRHARQVWGIKKHVISHGVLIFNYKHLFRNRTSRSDCTENVESDLRST